MTFFLNFIPELIEDGHLFATTPPLYIIRGNNNDKWICYSDKEADPIIQKLNDHNVKPVVTRLKGLGEMEAYESDEYLMNPKTRVFKQITMEDANRAKIVFNRLMGDDAEWKRKLISEGSVE